jgi:SAM-dependent methyltransferase
VASTDTLTNPYSDEFFDWMRQRSLASAQVIVPLLLELAPISSVVDVGCGDGTWLSEFSKRGVHDILGVDGFDIADTRLEIPESSFVRRDLGRPLVLERKFDLAISLEVAEHLPEERAQGFVRDLTTLSPLVAFSAAIPGQGGNGHLNEQFQDYWARLFAAEGYLACDCIRARVWDRAEVSFWYAQNLVLYGSREALESPGFRAVDVRGPLAIIHPRLYDNARAPVSVSDSLTLLTTGVRRAVGRRLRRLFAAAQGPE